jgi:transposase InsO family protein
VLAVSTFDSSADYRSAAIFGNALVVPAALDGWLHYYNHQRRHAALGHQPPITRVTNLPGSYT